MIAYFKFIAVMVKLLDSTALHHLIMSFIMNVMIKQYVDNLVSKFNY